MKTITRYRLSHVDDKGNVVVEKLLGTNRAGVFTVADSFKRYSTQSVHDSASAAALAGLKEAESDLRDAQVRLEELQHRYHHLALVVGNKRRIDVRSPDPWKKS